jgi:transposase
MGDKILNVRRAHAMIYAGLDIHKRYTIATATDEKGKVLNRSKILHGPHIHSAPWKEYVGQFCEPLCVTLEATGFWYPVYEALEPFVQDVKLAHPLKVRAIAEARIKTDKIDSEVLAHLLRTDLLPTAYIPSNEIRDGRELLRYRASLVSLQTSIKNKIHSILHRTGNIYQRSDLFGKSGRAWIGSLPLREIYREEINGYLRILNFLKGEIRFVTRRIHRELDLNEPAKLIHTLYGVGKYLALIIAMEIGDIHRFARSGKLVSWSGLVPSIHSSGGKIRYGSITRQGSRWLRWALILATQKYKHHKGALGQFYRRIESRHGSKAARVALARKLATIIWHMLSKNEPFDEEMILRDMHKGFGSSLGV